jgi:hypothetical protein
MRKTIIFSIILAFGVSISPGCKSLAKSAAKRWAKKKRKEFVEKCNNMMVNKPGIKAPEFCDCVLDLVMEAYPKPEEGMQVGVLELISLGKECVTGK